MRKLVLIAPALLSACSTAPAATPIVVHGETPGHTCVEGAANVASASLTGGILDQPLLL